MIPAYRDRENIIAFERRGEASLIVSNFQNRQASLDLPVSIETVILNNVTGLFQEGAQVLELALPNRCIGISRMKRTFASAKVLFMSSKSKAESYSTSFFSRGGSLR